MRQLRYLAVLAAVSVCLCRGQQYIPSGGPVYVNPFSPPPADQSAISHDVPSPLLTQTVYGFLDFTTTIGNTVMVFSPQSQPPVPETKPSTTPAIETRPPTTTEAPAAIKPSKITEKRENAADKKSEVNNAPVLSSIVQVIESPTSSVEEVREETLRADSPILFSKVGVREGNSQVVNIVQKEEVDEQPKIVLSSVVQIIGGEETQSAEPPRILSSVVQVISGPEVVSTQVNIVTQVPAEPVIFSSHVEVIAGKETVEEPAIQGNNIIEPEYDFLSRQPSEVVDETYRVINLRPSSKFHLKPRSSARAEDAQPTGLVTRMGGTIVKDGLTTIHETKVIGTFVSGKYTQVLQSSSKIKPSATAKILKTAGPNFGKSRFPHSEPLLAGSNYEETVALPLEALFSSPSNVNQIRGAKQPGGAQRNRFNIKNKLQDSREQDFETDNEDDDDIEIPSLKKQSKPVRPTQTQQRSVYRATKGYSKPGRSSSTASPELATVSVYTGEQPTSRRYQQQQQQQRRQGSFKSQSSTAAPPPENSFSRRGFKPKFQASPVENERTTTTSLYKFKLSRPTGRWSYKTTPKPRVTIRKQDEGPGDVQPTSPSPSPQFVPEQRSELRERTDDEDENDEEFEGDVAEVKQERLEHRESVPVAETIKVQISTPADFKDVYYEIATIRSPYTFQVGTVKNTRFITVTSTIEKSFIETTAGAAINPSSTITEPLTENILSTLAPHYTHTLPLDSSIATLPPIALASDMETPPLETLTETFSTTQQLLKTHILPVVRHGSDTQLYTLVQSYNVTRFVTAIKTLPPMEAYHFHPSRTLTDLNTRLEEAGSELHLELEFGDDNESDEPAALRALRPDIDLANVGSELDISDIDKLNLPDGPLRYKKTPEPLPKIATLPKQVEQAAQSPQYTQEQLQQLALLRFLNPAAAASLPQFVTSSRPIFKLETVYESHVLPLFDGVSTHYSTLSRPVGTVTKTEYEYVTSTVQPLPNINQLFPHQQAVAPQYQLTSTPVVTQTVVTQTQSKVLKLTFGAKTQFTTIYSTKVVPTVLTTYVTASIPVQQQQPAYNPFFAPQYQQLPQFPYIG